MQPKRYIARYLAYLPPLCFWWPHSINSRPPMMWCTIWATIYTFRHSHASCRIWLASALATCCSPATVKCHSKRLVLDISISADMFRISLSNSTNNEKCLFWLRRKQSKSSGHWPQQLQFCPTFRSSIVTFRTCMPPHSSQPCVFYIQRQLRGWFWRVQWDMEASLQKFWTIQYSCTWINYRMQSTCWIHW